MKCTTVRYAPVTFSSISVLPCVPSINTAFHEIGKASSDSLPALPYVHTDSTVTPLARACHEVFHISIAIVCDPSAYILGKASFQPFIAFTVAAARYLLETA